MDQITNAEDSVYAHINTSIKGELIFDNQSLTIAGQGLNLSHAQCLQLLFASHFLTSQY